MKRSVFTRVAAVAALFFVFAVPACSGHSSSTPPPVNQQNSSSTALPVSSEVQGVVDQINSGDYPTIKAEAWVWTASTWADWPAVTERPEIVITKLSSELNAGTNFVVENGSLTLRRPNVCEDVSACNGDITLQRINQPSYTVAQLNDMSMDTFLGG